MNDLLKNKNNTDRKAGIVCQEVIKATFDQLARFGETTSKDLINFVPGLNHRHINGMEALGYIKVRKNGRKILGITWNTVLNPENNNDLMALHLFMQISKSKKVMAANAEITDVVFEDGPIIKQGSIQVQEPERVAKCWPYEWKYVPGTTDGQFTIPDFQKYTEKQQMEFRINLCYIIEGFLPQKN